MKNYLKCWQKYAVMAGRAGRSEYWHFFLINLLINTALNILALNGLAGINVIRLIYSLAVLLPSLSVGVRRFHDVGRSGKSFACYVVPIVVCAVLLPVVEWATMPKTGLIPPGSTFVILLKIAVLFLPLILGIMLIIVLARPGQSETNQYGEPPVA